MIYRDRLYNMTTIIFFENRTSSAFRIFDLDHHLFGTIPASQTVNFSLNYSDTFAKQYNLFLDSGDAVTFMININGSIGQMITYGIANLTKTNEGNPKNSELPPNKLIIETSGTLKIAPPSQIPPKNDALLWSNFY